MSPEHTNLTPSNRVDCVDHVEKNNCNFVCYGGFNERVLIEKEGKL